MGAFGGVIPVTGLNYGFAGDYTSIYDREVIAKPVTPTAKVNINFGDPVTVITNQLNGYFQSVADFIAQGGTFTAALFRGIAKREVKTTFAYSNLLTQTPQRGSYGVNEFCEAGVRGSMLINLNAGVPLLNGPVYIRITANAAVPAGIVGGFEGAPASADAANLVAIPNLLFKSSNVDVNGNADVLMPTRVSA